MAEKKYLNDNGLSYLWLKLKDLFNGKVDKVEGKGLSERDFTQAYQTKLDSLKNYVLPIASVETLGGIKIGAGLQISDQGVLSVTGGGVADAVAWENVTDKPTTLAGYGITDVTISGQMITLGSSSITIPSKTSELTNDSNFLTRIPVATSSVLGGIKVGANLQVAGDGTLSASKVPTLLSELTNDVGFITSVPIATAETAGIIKVGTNLSISGDGTLSVTGIPTKVSELQNDSGYLTTIPIASSTVLGGIKVGTGLSISNGVLNVDIDEIVSNKILEDNKKKYPVGKIIMSTTNTNPSTYLGFGTWELWGSGRVPVGVDTEQTEFNSSEKEGGEKTHTLNVTEIPTHSHLVQGGTSYDGSHTHRVPFNLSDKESPGYIDYFNYGGYDYASFYPITQPGGGSHSHTMNFVSQNTGGGLAHNNLQPYITCYMWKRTA